MSAPSYAAQLTLATRVTEPAVRQAVRWLAPSSGSRGLDAGCGVGAHTVSLAGEVGAGGSVVGLDISPEHLEVAAEESRRLGLETRVEFVVGDIRALPFEDGYFDWVWCADTLYPVALVPDPVPVVREFARAVRPGGTIALAYWAGQSLLPGHAALEARLNSAFVSSVPYLAGAAPDLQYQRALGWLRAAGLRGVSARSFVADIQGPLGAAMRDSVDHCLSMLWEAYGEAASEDDRAAFRRLRDPASPDWILGSDEYYGFVVYTLFTGSKPSSGPVEVGG